MAKKISVVIPCYNSDKFIHRLFDSLLNQTIHDFEVIVVNDGSTDNTEKIIKKYIKKFNEVNIDFKYIKQKNEGQASALNNGLQYVKGEYLMWPDSDDYLEHNALEILSKELDNNKDISYIKSNAVFRDEETLEIIKIPKPIDKKKTNYFEDYLYVTQNVCCFVGTIIRTKDFKKANKGMEIYKGKAGQNWQMLLPIMYFYKGKYIDVNTYNYLVRKQSHSHSIITKKQRIQRTYDLEDILINTLDHLDIENNKKKKYMDNIKKQYKKERKQLYKEYSYIYRILRKVKRMLWK